MKTKNIYLTMKDKKLLSDIKNKYHLSFSTIADIIIYPIYQALSNRLSEDMYKGEKTYKTSIKPRQSQYTSRQYTIAIKLFIRKDLKNYVNDKENQKINTLVYNQFSNTYDENWNGNREVRSITRYIKRNPEYVRRLLGEND